MAGTGPLQGKRLLVTRPEDEQETAAEAIRARGGVPIACPTIRIAPPHDWGPFDDAIQRIDQFDWVIFTSANAVRSFAQRFKCASNDLSQIALPRFAALGPGVQAAMREDEIPTAFIAAQANAQAFATEFLDAYNVRDQRILLPLSDIARRTLPEALANAGALVEEVVAYRNLPTDALPPEAATSLKRGEIDWALFFSPSTARNFFHMTPPEATKPKRFRVASIGPTTSDALRELGHPPDVEALPHTLEGLLQSIQQGLGVRG